MLQTSIRPSYSSVSMSFAVAPMERERNKYSGTPYSPAITFYNIQRLSDSTAGFDDRTPEHGDDSEIGIRFHENEKSEWENATIILL